MYMYISFFFFIIKRFLKEWKDMYLMNKKYFINGV